MSDKNQKHSKNTKDSVHKPVDTKKQAVAHPHHTAPLPTDIPQHKDPHLTHATHPQVPHKQEQKLVSNFPKTGTAVQKTDKPVGGHKTEHKAENKPGEETTPKEGMKHEQKHPKEIQARLQAVHADKHEEKGDQPHKPQAVHPPKNDTKLPMVHDEGAPKHEVSHKPDDKKHEGEAPKNVGLPEQAPHIQKASVNARPKHQTGVKLAPQKSETVSHVTAHKDVKQFGKPAHEKHAEQTFKDTTHHLPLQKMMNKVQIKGGSPKGKNSSQTQVMKNSKPAQKDQQNPAQTAEQNPKAA